MAKIKSNNFLGTVNGVFTDVKEVGVLHLYAEDKSFLGRTIQIQNKKLFHFGITGYNGKEDLLTSETVSFKLEQQRKKNPYLFISYVLSMESPFTEGQYYDDDENHSDCAMAFNMMFKQLEELNLKLPPFMLVLTDFKIDSNLNQNFHQQGFIKTIMPDS